MRKDTGDAPADVTRSHIEDGAPAPSRIMVFWEGGAAIYPLPQDGKLVIGRTAECELHIDHASVSRRHALLHVGARLFVEDLGSSNGTRVRGERLARGKRREVAVGEFVEIGAAQLVVQRAPVAPAQRPTPLVMGASMKALYETIDQMAASDLSILLLGETGVGKEVVASRVHDVSSRRAKLFVRINCAALPDALLESELFGHERGAFTGATSVKQGLLETAAGGTVLLDEIGELPIAMQSKILRALENREVFRLGGTKPLAIDVRFIGATSRDIDALVQGGQFRSDLYYRISGAVIRIPPLRERRDEIVVLAESFIAAACERASRAVPMLGNEARKALEAHDFPGNIRELRNVVERAVLLCKGDVIEPTQLSFQVALPGPTIPPATDSFPAFSASGAGPKALRGEIDSLQRKRILETLERCGGNQSRAAKELGISRRTLLTRLDEYGIPRPRK